MTKKALIDPLMKIESGYRVAQVEPESKIFPVGEPYFWVTCDDNILADQFWYDPIDETIKSFSIIVEDAPSELTT